MLILAVIPHYRQEDISVEPLYQCLLLLIYLEGNPPSQTFQNAKDKDRKEAGGFFTTIQQKQFYGLVCLFKEVQLGGLCIYPVSALFASCFCNDICN